VVATSQRAFNASNNFIGSLVSETSGARMTASVVHASEISLQAALLAAIGGLRLDKHASSATFTTSGRNIYLLYYNGQILTNYKS